MNERDASAMEPFRLVQQEPSSAASEPLDLVVTDIYRIRERGTVTTGEIRAGILRQGDVVEIARPDGQTMRARVRAIEFACGPNVRRDVVGFLLESRADDFLVVGAVIRSVGNE
jgi:translation elongation factor EF-Tu-like GTPase